MISGLEPDTSYQVRVLAGNTAGYPKYGNKDFWVKYRTPRGDARGKANLFFLSSVCNTVYIFYTLHAVKGKVINCIVLTTNALKII